MAHQVILELGIVQFREFESPRVHTRIKIRRDFFLCTNRLAESARARVSNTLDEKPTSSGIAETCARKKSMARTGGKKGRPL